MEWPVWNINDIKISFFNWPRVLQSRNRLWSRIHSQHIGDDFCSFPVSKLSLPTRQSFVLYMLAFLTVLAGLTPNHWWFSRFPKQLEGTCDNWKENIFCFSTWTTITVQLTLELSNETTMEKYCVATSRLLQLEFIGAAGLMITSSRILSFST